MRALAPLMGGPLGAAGVGGTGEASVPSVVVVGGGVTGLAAAHAVHRARPDVALFLFESRPELGGNIATHREQGFVLDAGPDSFLRTKPEALALCRELGLEPLLVSPRESARHVFVARQGQLERMPGGMALAVPTKLGPLLRTKLLSPLGKLRLLMEPFIRRSLASTDESMEAFFTRRLGREGARMLAGPLLAGIYAGDVSRLSIQATFPQLVLLERRYGSLIRGFLALELGRGPGPGGYGVAEAPAPRMRDVLAWLVRGGDAQAPSPFLSLRSGMGSLIAALEASLPPGTVHTNTPVTRIERVSGGFRVAVGGGAVFARSVIVAAPAHVAARLVPDPALASELAAIPYVSTATVFFALSREHVTHDLDGFGFIVPPGEASVLASTWVSSKWDDRAPEGSVLVRAFLGGARDPHRVVQSTDAELVALARAELERLMGSFGSPLFTRVYRYTEAGPQPNVGHGARLARIRARLATVPGLHLAGAAYEGVGIPDCIRQASAAAQAALISLSSDVPPERADDPARSAPPP